MADGYMHRKVHNFLCGLGHSPAEVAQKLADLGALGMPQSRFDNPICMALRMEFATTGFERSGEFVQFRLHGRLVFAVRMPMPIQVFLEQFDKGMYKALDRFGIRLEAGDAIVRVVSLAGGVATVRTNSGYTVEVSETSLFMVSDNLARRPEKLQGTPIRLCEVELIDPQLGDECPFEPD